ncbi:hypothetical protein D3C71_2007980 [compost metagenome]
MGKVNGGVILHFFDKQGKIFVFHLDVLPYATQLLLPLLFHADPAFSCNILQKMSPKTLKNPDSEESRRTVTKHNEQINLRSNG